MREQNNLAALVRDFLNRRRDAFDARRIGHTAVLRRHVEIDAQQHALAGQVCLVERAERFRHGASQASGSSDAFRFRPFERAFATQFWTPAFAGVAPNPQISFAIATAVSAMRFEKPHSLSYQDSTRTNWPSITLV